MKRLIIGIMFVLALTQSSYAEDIKIEVNDELVEFENKPCIVNDRTLVPVKFIMDTLGYKVEWFGETREVEITRGSERMLLTIDKSEIDLNGDIVISDVNPTIIDDRTYVPLALIAEATGAEVLWDNETRTVKINEKLDFINVYYGSGSYKNYKAIEEELNVVEQISYAWSRVEVEDGAISLNTTSTNDNTMFFPSGHELVTTASGEKLLNIYADGSYDVIFSQSQDLIQSIKSKVLSPNLDEPEFDGVVINFENIKAEDYTPFLAFLGSLNETVPTMTINVAVQPRNHDYALMLPYIDHLILMLHDYESKNDVIVNFNQSYVEQQTASIEDIRADLENILVNIDPWDRSKVLLQVNLAVVQWQGQTLYEVKRYTPSYSKLIARLEQLSFDAFNFDEVAKQPYVQYESDSMVNTIWYENENSISEKIKLIYDYDLGGLSVWQLGNMVNDVDETVSEKYQLNIWEKIMENNRSSD